VAMVILTLGLFAVINLQVIAVRGNTFARARTDAQKIAQGVSDEIRTQGLRWLGSNMLDYTWAGIFPNLPLTDPPSGAGVNLNLVGSALLIDVAAGTGPGAMYRVHYVAHLVPLAPGAAASPNLVRVTVYVSWDSKDHGQQDYQWDDWWGAGGDNYFKRHVVSVTQFLSKRRI